MNKKKSIAFTLAEVLITLTIIGVVAAVTVPTLTKKTGDQETITKLQKAYSTLSQATDEIILEKGNPKCSTGGWACSANGIYDTYKPYLKTAKECTQELCIPGTAYKYLSGETTNSAGQYDVSTWGGFKKIGGQYNSFILTDGIVINVQGLVWQSCDGTSGMYVTGTNNQCAVFLVDLNGKKAPNIIGRDTFQFVLKEDGLYPAGCENDSVYCRTNSYGTDCACKVLNEGKIDY